MKRFLQFLAVVAIGIVIVVFIKTGSFSFLNQIKDYTHSVPSKETVQESLGTIAETIKKEISNPVPLISKINSLKAHLTHDGVIAWTNTQRKNVSNLPPLADNSKLDQIAEERLADMFAKQYFEHISPQGIGATNLASDIGYDYISLGENIALGNFENDEVLVQAWMDSPGHRANILNTKFTEIGVAVGQGTYEGRTTWIAVQVFGRPNTCTAVDQNLKKNIDTLTSSLNQGKIKIDALTAELDSIKNDPNVNRDLYNQKVEEYNSLAHELNSLSASVKTQVNNYNVQVRTFNECIKS